MKKWRMILISFYVLSVTVSGAESTVLILCAHCWQNACTPYCLSGDLPAVCSLRRQDVREKHLRHLPEIQKLVSAAAKSHVEVRTVFIKGCLLKMLRVLHYTGKAEITWVHLLKQLKWFYVWYLPFCLALLMISMCFIETLSSFLVMRDATST